VIVTVAAVLVRLRLASAGGVAERREVDRQQRRQRADLPPVVDVAVARRLAVRTVSPHASAFMGEQGRVALPAIIHVGTVSVDDEGLDFIAAGAAGEPKRRKTTAVRADEAVARPAAASAFAERRARAVSTCCAYHPRGGCQRGGADGHPSPALTWVAAPPGYKCQCGQPPETRQQPDERVAEQ